MIRPANNSRSRISTYSPLEKRVDVRSYIEWLGHFEFGVNFRPIDFDQWQSRDDVPTKIDNDFWLRYWTAAYEFVLKNISSDMCLVDFDSLLDRPETSLERIAGYVELRDIMQLTAEVQSLRAPTTRPSDSDLFLRKNRDAAFAVHEQLTAQVF